MEPLPIALILAAAVAVAVALHRRSSDEVGRVAVPVAVLAVPIAAFAVIPIFDGVEAAGKRGPVCRIVGPSDTRPGACRPKQVLEPGAYTLSPNAVRTPGGERLPFGEQPEGFVDQARVRGGRLRLSGWAGDRDAGRPAAAVLIFVGNRYAGAVAPTGRRTDIADLFGDEGAVLSGFDVRLPTSAGKLTTVALSDGRAGKLTYDCSQPREFGC
jgi:hypothetical protein